MVLYQPQNGYCYNSDTHFLFNFFLQSLSHYKNISGELLDIGSGSGILGLLITREYPKLKLNQCEIQDVFQFLSQKNSSINNINSNLYKGNILEINFDKKFNYIVSNPPFYHSNVIKTENENIKTARYNDNLPLNKWIKKVSTILENKGIFCFCYDSKQLDNIFQELRLNKLNIEALQFLHPKEIKEASLVMITARKNSKSLLKVLPPLIMFDNQGNFTREVLDIYDKCSTHSIKCDVL